MAMVSAVCVSGGKKEPLRMTSAIDRRLMEDKITIGDFGCNTCSVNDLSDAYLTGWLEKWSEEGMARVDADKATEAFKVTRRMKTAEEEP